MAIPHNKLRNTAIPKSSDNAMKRGGSGGGDIPTRKNPSYRGTLDDGSGRGFGKGASSGGGAPEQVQQPKRAGYAGSRTVNQHSGVPTSIQDMGKSRFGSLSSGDSVDNDSGELDCGDGTGWGGKRP